MNDLFFICAPGRFLASHLKLKIYHGGGWPTWLGVSRLTAWWSSQPWLWCTYDIVDHNYNALWCQLHMATRANLQMSRQGTDWAQRCVKTTTGQLDSDLRNWSTLQCKSMRQNYRSIKFWQRNWDNEVALRLQWQSFKLKIQNCCILRSRMS